MAQLTVPIEFDHEDLQEMVEQAKREIAAACITKEQAKNMGCVNFSVFTKFCKNILVDIKGEQKWLK